MTHANRLRRSPAAFRRLSGITRAAFDRLLTLQVDCRAYVSHAIQGFLFGSDDSCATGRSDGTSTRWPRC